MTSNNCNQKISNLLVLFFISWLSGNLSAATITWNGGVGIWDSASNWDIGQIPTIADDVIINSGQIKVESLGHANTIRLNQGRLIIKSTLLVEGQDADLIKIGEGASLSNSGFLVVIGSSSLFSGSALIDNEGTLENYADGYIYAKGSDYIAIAHDSDANFANYGEIEMHDVHAGIDAYNSIYNYGSISIDASSFAVLFTEGQLYIGSSGRLSSNHVMAFDGGSSVNNSGEIIIRTDLSTEAAIILDGRMDVQESASIEIEGNFDVGIQVGGLHGEAYIHGDVNINLENFYNQSITNAGTIVNYASGNVSCTSYYGVISNGSQCINYGTWTFTYEVETPYSSVIIEGDFLNLKSGKLYIEKRLELDEDSSIENDGHMFVSSPYTQPFIGGEIVNRGVLNDLNGHLTSVTNSGIIARPILFANIIEDALDVGANSVATALEWYTTRTGNVSAGIYDHVANTFAPHREFAGSYSFFVDIMNNINGTIERHEVKFPNAGDFKHPIFSSSISTDLNQDSYDVHVFPNPASDFLNIKTRNDSDEAFDISLVNMQGRIVLSQQCSRNCQVDIPSELLNGIYVLSIHIDGKYSEETEAIKIFR